MPINQVLNNKTAGPLFFEIQLMGMQVLAFLKNNVIYIAPSNKK